MTGSGVRYRLLYLVTLVSAIGAVSGCGSEEPESCGPASREDAQAANESFFEEKVTKDGFRDGIKGHGVSKDDGGWFILVTVTPGQLESGDRPECFDGVPVSNPVMRPKGGWKSVVDVEIAVARCRSTPG